MKTTKLQAPAKQLPVTVLARFAKDDIRALKFVTTSKHIVVTCRGLPRITVREYGGPRRANDKYEAFIVTANGREAFVLGSSQKSCYKRAVRQFWVV